MLDQTPTLLDALKSAYTIIENNPQYTQTLGKAAATIGVGLILKYRHFTNKDVKEIEKWQLSRHPTFTGYRAIMSGIFLDQPGEAELLGALFIYLATEMQARKEERYLINKFGDEYENYARDVPRWLNYKAIPKKIKEYYNSIR